MLPPLPSPPPPASPMPPPSSPLQLNVTGPCVVGALPNCVESSNYSEGGSRSGGYSDREDCFVTGYPEEAIIVEPGAFDVEFEASCDWDYLEVTNTEGVPTKYCGINGPDGVVASGTIIWHSNVSENKGGWRICFGFAPPLSPNLPPPPPPPPSTSGDVASGSGSVDFGSGSDSGDLSSGDLLADPPPLTPATSPPTTPPSPPESPAKACSCPDSWLGDGVCDDEQFTFGFCNVPECQYDGGDCNTLPPPPPNGSSPMPLPSPPPPSPAPPPPSRPPPFTAPAPSDTCDLHFVPGDLSKFADSASIVPIIATLNGTRFGYGVDGTTQTTSCDQIAAIGVADGVVRGTSTLLETMFSLGMIGAAGELIEFRYWSAAEEKEYYVDSRYEMQAGGQRGSFEVGRAFELVLLEEPKCYPCESGCSHYLLEASGVVFMIEAPAGGCVENAKTCEIATSSGTSSCHTGVDTASPKCYTPCAALVPPSPPPSPSPPPPNGATPTPPPSGSVDFGSGSDSGDVSSGDLLADPPPLTPATSPPTTPPLSLSPAKGAGVITFSVTIAGTVDDFDSNGQYKLRLAQAVQVQEADITLLVTPASIRVTALIQVTSQSEQVVTMGSLGELVLLGPKNASSVLNVELEAIDQPTFAPSGSSTPPPSPSRPPLSPPPRSPSPPLLPLADSR